MFIDFLKILGLTLGIAWVLLIPLFYFLAQSVLIREVLIGCFLPVVCFILGFYAVSWAVLRPLLPFMTAVVAAIYLLFLVIVGPSLLLLLLPALQRLMLLLCLYW